MIVTPKVSEKAYQSAQTGTYVFTAPLESNKNQVIAAIEADYNVKVVDARVVISKGKAVRSSRGKRAMPATAQRQDTKKVYVRLAEGNKLNLFGEESEEKK
ncbi:MAG TPA: 50S ribosomal protein L23 [Candidatus Saccharibacteria bacterium]|nr:50S ribosomal protein L23 [Candidatus Saccharibacteria bacterium]